MNKPRIRITWFPKQNRGVIDCLFRLRGRDDIHVEFSGLHMNALESLDLGERVSNMVGATIGVMKYGSIEGLSWPPHAESITVDLGLEEE